MEGDPHVPRVLATFSFIIMAVLFTSIMISREFAYANEEQLSPTELSALKLQTINVPQTVYGVAVGAPKFRLNASANTKLNYESEDTSVADVSSSGQVTVKKKGTVRILIRAEETDQYASAAKSVLVRVSRYIPAKRSYVQADANYDRKPGDSNGKETKYSRFRYHKTKNWMSWGFIIRCNDPYVANHAARAAGYIARNDHFGYNARLPVNQKTVDKRASVYKAIHKAVGDNPSYKDLKKIRTVRTKADTSCTPTVLAGYWLYYDMSTKISLKWRYPYSRKSYKYYCGAVNVEYHQLEKAIRTVNREYAKAGKLKPFTIIYIPRGKRSSFFNPKKVKQHLKRGDIICSCPNYNRNGHTAIMQ